MAHFKTSRSLNWHYTQEGSGETIVFIHGFGGSGGWWHKQADFLRKNYQVIVLDLPGHGSSQWMPVTLSEMAIDIRQILSAAGSTHVSIVASSFGTLVAMELYRLMAEHVMRMSFVGGIPKFARTRQYPAGLDIDKIRRLSGQFDGNYAAVLDMFFRSLFTLKERESEQFKDLKHLRSIENLPQRQALKAFLDILQEADLRDRLASTICPLQFITGAEDYLCPRPVMDWVAQHTLNARFDFMQDCGHLPFLTQAGEYNRLLEDFLIS